MTIDPVSTGGEEWEKFLEAYNKFCSDRNGAPLPNQTRGATPAIAKRAYGDRLKEMAETRQTYDPKGRLLNDYFRSLFT
jgi:FAD/FMN-containing dehydrogenase